MAKIKFASYYLDIQLPPSETMTDEEFSHFCEQNKHVSIERDENHQIIFMPPVTSEFSNKNGEIFLDLGNWNRKLNKD